MSAVKGHEHCYVDGKKVRMMSPLNISQLLPSDVM